MSPNYAVGDIVAIRFPFTNFQVQKLRPALVIATPRNKNDVIVSKITSAIKGGEYRLPINNNDLAQGKLPKTSELDTAHLYTIQKALIQGRWCALNVQKKNEAISAIKSCIGE